MTQKHSLPQRSAAGLLTACVTAVATGCVVLGTFFGFPDAFDLVMQGRETSNPLAALALVVVGWMAGKTRHSRYPGTERLSAAHGVATAMFLALLLLLNPHLVSSWQAFGQGLGMIAVALLIWLLVVIEPWVAFSHSKAMPDQKASGRTPLT